jgi:DNA-binding winged helix-turn-helix (wHTH) protein
MRVRFGEFILDTGTRQLRQSDTERHVSPKAFDLLRLLVENRPRALSKGELHERLWPATFVSEATLSSLVAEVRDALGEKAGDAQFVRTVHRFGYAFNGEATDLTADAAGADARVRCWVIWEFGQVPLGDGTHLVGRDSDVAVWLESPWCRGTTRVAIAGDDVTVEDLEARTAHVRGSASPRRSG